MSDPGSIRIILFCIFLHLGGEIRDFSDRFLEKYLSRSREGDESSRVIASIFEITQSLDEEWNRIFLTIVGKYSAHRLEVVSGMVTGDWFTEHCDFHILLRPRKKSKEMYSRCSVGERNFSLPEEPTLGISEKRICSSVGFFEILYRIFAFF